MLASGHECKEKARSQQPSQICLPFTLENCIFISDGTAFPPNISAESPLLKLVFSPPDALIVSWLGTTSETHVAAMTIEYWDSRNDHLMKKQQERTTVMTKHISYQKRVLLIEFSLFIFLPVARAQQSEVMQSFRQTEQENWQEYIHAVKSLPAESNFDVRFYHLSIDLNIASPYLQGNMLCRFSTTENNTTSIKLSLRREFTIDSITGNTSSFVFAGDSIVISLDRVFQVGDSGWITVYYRGIPPVANNTKGLRYVTHATNQRVIVSLSTPFLSYYWWPCKDGPGDKPDSVYVDISIPDTSIAGIPVVAISNGVLSNIVSAGGKNTFEWREHYPIIPYYVMAAVSNYRDFHQTFSGTHQEQFPLDYYVFDEHLTAAQQGVADLPQAMELFSDKFGVYPFATEKYGMTQLGFYGAIENQTNTIINNMGLSYFGVSVHELAHMWFGDMITCQNWHHGWLNEGFATYCEALWAEHTGGFNSYKNYMQNFQFFSGGTLYLQDISDPFNIFISIIYDKGAYVLHMLRGVLGDSVFFACLSAYASDPALRYGHATTEDFESVCESVSQQNLAFFFQQWVYDQYYPMYGYSYSQNLSTWETTVTIRQTQSSLGRRTVFTMPVQLKFLFQGGGDTTLTVWNDQQIQTYQITIPHAIAAMQFDPDGWILKTSQGVEVSEQQSPTQPNRFALGQNFPDPFNPTTTIKYQLPIHGYVILRVFDILGREVATLVNGMKQPGKYTVQFNGTGLASGVYFYKLETVDFVDVKKFILFK
jgi:Peptidase family M1 domain